MLAEQDRIKRLLNEFLNPAFNLDNDAVDSAKQIAVWHERQRPCYPPRRCKCPGCNPPGGENITVTTLPRFNGGWHLPNSGPLCDILLDVKSILGIYLHGSYATGHNVESSDVDLTYIIADSVASNPEALLDLQLELSNMTEYLFRVDPLQHHGPYILSQRMLRSYLECYLPLDVWRNSRPIKGGMSITFNVIKSEEHDKAAFEKSLKYYNMDIDLSTEYLRKRFVCMANMIPAVLYPWKTGKYTTKYEATKWMRREYTFTAGWALELYVRRETGGYDQIDSLVKQTKDICNRIKEMG